MPLVQTRGAASAQGFGEFAQASAVPNYIEDVFSCFLYTGNGSTQTITNGIDLSTKGGLLWMKSRSQVAGHMLYDTASNATLRSDSTSANSGYYPTYINPTSSGFFLDASAGGGFNTNAVTYASWTFRKQPKFFDIVTWTGDSTSGRTVAHNLGSVPGSIIVKCTSAAVGGGWPVYHRSLGNTQTAVLNETSAAFTYGYWNNTTPTSTVFTLNGDSDVNGTGKTYVAYLFAHDAGGFGLTGTDNVISCGTFVTGSGGKMTAPVNLGYEVQWLLVKNSGSSENWQIYDTMRGMSNTGYSVLYPNLTSAEYSGASAIAPNATGFDTPNASGPFASFANYIYVAIRRGPMKVPTSGTSVFAPITYAGDSASRVITGVGFSSDLVLNLYRQNNAGWSNAVYTADRLRGLGVNKELLATSSGAEGASGISPSLGYISAFTEDGFNITAGTTSAAFVNLVNTNYVNYLIKRAPSVFDIVCYTGTGSATTFAHNLTVAPELIFIKCRSAANGGLVYNKTITASKYLELFFTGEGAFAASGPDAGPFNSTEPTSSVFSVGTYSNTNGSGATYVAYLFATCAGVSKVGTYTGNGTTQTIDCGFGAGGARFVLIKRTDSTGGWYAYDTARGMTVLTDPYLLFNTNASEVATLGSVTTVSTGFALDSTILAAINVNGGNYIFLAFA